MAKYQPEYCELATNYCMLGATNAELAQFLKVSSSTMKEWRLKHPEFDDAVRRGKEHADARVAKALFSRATGYSHPDTHISNYRGDITVTETIKHYAPDTLACIYWLKNRRPDLWRDRVEVTGKDGGAIETTDTTDLQAAREVAFALATGANAVKKAQTSSKQETST